MLGIEAPQSGVIKLRGAKFEAGGDDALDLDAFAWESAHRRRRHRQGDATGVAHRGSGQVARGVIGAREDATPQELTFSQCLVELGDKVLRDGCREGRDKASKRFVRVRVVLGQDRLTWRAEGAEVVNHGGDQ